ncbi:interleukin-2 receptor subunit beta [Gastrophryne carolinensis]
MAGTNFLMTLLTPLVVIGILVPLVMLIVFQKRVKKIIWISVPSPSSFFDPLISTHKGNFQKWLSSPFPFSSFYPDPTPSDISPLDINWNMKEHHLKNKYGQTKEMQTETDGLSSSEFCNKCYFSPMYDHHQVFETISLPSPTEDMPLFHADYLCAPLFISGLHNKSFVDFQVSNLQMPILVEEVKDKAEDHNDYPKEEAKEEEKQSVEVQNESSTAGPITLPIPTNIQPLSHENDKAAEYLSLNELQQKHIPSSNSAKCVMGDNSNDVQLQLPVPHCL